MIDEKKLDDLAEKNVNRDFLDLIDADRSVRFFKLGYRQAFADQQKKIEKLEKVVEMMRSVLQGCSDGNCILRDRTGGQHTNGGCRCKRNAKQTLAEVDSILKGAES